jgi:predicted TIM-barrel fold metal-dependent hydrolase
MQNPLARSSFLAAAGGVAALVAVTPGALFAQGSPAPGRIDVHHHYFPPEYLKNAKPVRTLPPPMTGWVPQRSLDDMDRGGVRTAMLSITTPGIWYNDAALAKSLARACNDYAAGLRRTYPGRFGMFTVLPLPDVAGSLVELAYGFDTLKADGVGVFTSYPGGIWLGSPKLDPIFAELERRKAVVFVHPTSNACCADLTEPNVDDSMIEYETDTARAIANYVFSGAAERYPNVKMIFSHGGGTMPVLIGRFLVKQADPIFGARVPGGVVKRLQSFYYDTAQIANAQALGALTKLVPPSRIVFGTDFPYGSAARDAGALPSAGAFSDADLALIANRNAQALFPRLA